MRYHQFFTPEPLPAAIERSTYDSDRFGLSIGRLELGAVDARHTPDAIRGLLRACPHELVILRYPSAQVNWFARLLDPSYTLIQADTLLYWSRPLCATDATPELTLPVYEASDMGQLATLVRSIFVAYTNHYAANPDLPTSNAIEGYVEWAQSWAMHPDRSCLLVGLTDQPLGMVTVDVTDQIAEIALIGTTPEARGRGVAAELMRCAQAWAVQRGAHTLVISTQAHNMRIQRVWSREGYRPLASLNTLHIRLHRAGKP